MWVDGGELPQQQEKPLTGETPVCGNACSRMLKKARQKKLKG
jgi:hypothetical protein